VVLHCGHSLCEQCLKKMLSNEAKSCSICQTELNQDDKKYAKNYALIEYLKKEKEVSGGHQNEYALICIDVSTSMRYSDCILPFFGTSRLEVAKLAAIDLVTKKNKPNFYVSLYKFGTQTIIVQDFSDQHHKQLIQNIRKLEPTDKHTAMFEALYDCVSRLSELKEEADRNLFFFTDGGENFSSDTFKKTNAKLISKWKILTKEKRLKTVIIGVSSTHGKNLKEFAHSLNLSFRIINETNYKEVVHHIVTETGRLRQTSILTQKQNRENISPAVSKDKKSLQTDDIIESLRNLPKPPSTPVIDTNDKRRSQKYDNSNLIAARSARNSIVVETKQK